MQTHRPGFPAAWRAPQLSREPCGPQVRDKALRQAPGCEPNRGHQPLLACTLLNSVWIAPVPVPGTFPAISPRGRNFLLYG